jgi:hypothetical protein
MHVKQSDAPHELLIMALPYWKAVHNGVTQHSCTRLKYTVEYTVQRNKICDAKIPYLFSLSTQDADLSGRAV